MKNAWIDVNDCAGWLACLMLGCSAASGVAAEWGAAASELEPLQHEIAAADVHEAPLAAKAGPLSFGKAWQIPSWIDPRGDAGVDDVDGEGASGGIDLVGFAFGHHGHQAACGPECYDCPPSSILDDHLGCGVRWTATVDAMLLWQNNIASRPLFISTTSPFATAVDANQLQTPTSVGPRFGLFYHIDNCHSIEGNYFNVQSFQGEYQPPYAANGYAAVDLASPLPYVVDGVQATSSGEIKSAELNWRRHAGLVTWLAGFRWVEWNGDLNVRSTSPLGQDLIGVATGNDLYGGQLGADVLLWQGTRGLQLNTLGKAGVFYNTAYQSTTGSVAAQPPYAGAARSAADQTAFFGELGINGAWWITDSIAWRMGYSFFWLSGVATPAEQLSRVDISVTPAMSSINTEGSVFLQGFTTGIEARW